jgi:2-polyprenyl-6-methoxyphenol hydroxylase-like FAD-dependent oxidoreductase
VEQESFWFYRGDAYHAMMPYMALGAAMAIEDAAMLARCLVQADDHSTAFALYQTTRMSRVTKVQRMSAENRFLRHPTDPIWVFGYHAVTSLRCDMWLMATTAAWEAPTRMPTWRSAGGSSADWVHRS